MAGPLSGIRVLDCSTGTAGPRATGMLADYGADVVWVEPPGGDRFREVLAVPYSVFNRGKSSVVADLRDGAGAEPVFDLLASADVLVHSWRPGVAERLGFGYEDLHSRLPSLVYCSISGFGVDGPNRDVPGYEALVHAIVGTMADQPGLRPPPIYEALPFASIGAAYLAAIAISAALYRRFDDGVGRHVETSLLDGALAYLTMLWGDADVPPPPRDPGANRLVARNFVCSDGAVLGVHTGAIGAFGRLMRLLGLDDRVPPSDHGLDMGIRLTPEQRQMLDTALPELFATKPSHEWEALLTEADICAIPLLRPGEVFDAPQARHNDMVIRVEDPGFGTVEQVAPALKFARTPAPPPAGAPLVDSGAPSWPSRGGNATRPVVGDPIDDRPLLDGLRVLDLGAYYAGPYGSRLLADLGADVVRVETLLGDPNRGSERVFRSSHAGKRSVALDLKRPESVAVAQELMKWADVVHHSMRPGAAERLGVGYEHARSVNPSVVYAYAPGWGSSGPMKDRQSFAPLMSGYVGVAHEVAGQYNPPAYPVGNEDPGNGLLGALGMLMGVLHKRATGEGQNVEHPQLNAAMVHIAHVIRPVGGEPLGAMRMDPLQVGVGALDRLYQTSDGWVCVVATCDREIEGLEKVLGVQILADPRFATAAAREENADVLAIDLEEAFGARSTEQVLLKLRAAGVAAAVPVSSNNSGFLRDPENLRTGRSAMCPHDTRGRVFEVGVLIRASHSTVAPHRLAPPLGGHNDEVLATLGFTAAQVERLRESRAIL